MASDKKYPTVLALGSGLTLLGVMRALAQTGIEAMALPDAQGPALESRFFRSAPSPLAGLTAAKLPAALTNLPAPTVLMPCSDYWVRAVSRLGAETVAKYPASVPPPEAVDTVVDKNRFRATLSLLALPHPKTRAVSSLADLEDVPDNQIPYSFLKPVGSQEFFARFGIKAFRIADRADAERKLATCIDGGFEMLFQEYIPGPPTNHYFVDGFIDRHGVPRARFARQRLRMNPPDFGNSTLMKSVPLEAVDDAARTLDALFAHLHYRGIFSAEFKRDERDNRFNLIEVNARPWWYVEFAARCGVNVCQLAVRDALGEDVPTVGSYAVGKRCVYPYYDLDAVRAERAAGRMSLIGWARSWLGAYQPVFRWMDPAPAVREVARLVRRKVNRRV